MSILITELLIEAWPIWLLLAFAWKVRRDARITREREERAARALQRQVKRDEEAERKRPIEWEDASAADTLGLEVKHEPMRGMQP